MSAILQEVKITSDDLRDLVIAKAKADLHVHNGRDPIGTGRVEFIIAGEENSARRPVKEFTAYVTYETNGAGPRPKS